MSFSIGIAYTEDSGTDPEALIRDADAAMYRAKDRGRNRYELFDQELRLQVLDRLTVETELRGAIAAGQVVPFFQPKIDLRTGRMVGTEALARWQHPDRGLLLPAAFIDVAEESGLIIPLGRHILRAACEQTMAWQHSHPHLDDLFVCVNMSARELGNADVIGAVAEIVDDTGIDPGHLDIEVTESVLLDDVDRAAERLDELKELGVKIVVDDFGTGYSSLSYLRRFPVDLLKIDRSFVDGLGVEDDDTTIVTAVVGLAHALGLEVIGEGVETPGQLALLRDLDCEYAQGFHLGHPVPGDDIDVLLATDPVW